MSQIAYNFLKVELFFLFVFMELYYWEHSL